MNTPASFKLAILIFFGACSPCFNSGCAAQDQLIQLASYPGKLEQATLITYRASLDACALLAQQAQIGAQSEPLGTGVDTCRANIKESFRPLIELYEEAHQFLCQLVPDHPVCKEKVGQ